MASMKDKTKGILSKLSAYFYTAMIGFSFVVGFNALLKNEDLKKDHQACEALLEQNKPCSAPQTKAHTAYVRNQVTSSLSLSLMGAFTLVSIYAGEARRYRGIFDRREKMDALFAEVKKAPTPQGPQA